MILTNLKSLLLLVLVSSALLVAPVQSQEPEVSVRGFECNQNSQPVSRVYSIGSTVRICIVSDSYDIVSVDLLLFQLRDVSQFLVVEDVAQEGTSNYQCTNGACAMLVQLDEDFFGFGNSVLTAFGTGVATVTLEDGITIGSGNSFGVPILIRGKPLPTVAPTKVPTLTPTTAPTTSSPTPLPSFVPTLPPTSTRVPSLPPSMMPSPIPTSTPSLRPSVAPTSAPVFTSSPTTRGDFTRFTPEPTQVPRNGNGSNGKSSSTTLIAILAGVAILAGMGCLGVWRFVYQKRGGRSSLVRREELPVSPLGSFDANKRLKEQQQQKVQEDPQATVDDDQLNEELKEWIPTKLKYRVVVDPMDEEEKSKSSRDDGSINTSGSTLFGENITLASRTTNGSASLLYGESLLPPSTANTDYDDDDDNLMGGGMNRLVGLPALPAFSSNAHQTAPQAIYLQEPPQPMVDPVTGAQLQPVHYTDTRSEISDEDSLDRLVLHGGTLPPPPPPPPR